MDSNLTTPCTSVNELRRWVAEHLQLSIPVRPVCAHHNAPMEYLRLAYFEPAPDLVIWAPRGGGKTRLAAVATLLDLLHKPGIQVRILGGSLEQSLRLWEHLLPDLEQHARIVSRTRTRRIVLANRSQAAALPQSERAVRGQRVQKLRCDEIELFNPDIWSAAQFVTRSAELPPGSSQLVRGSVEALSTMHQAGGMMERIVDQARAAGKPVLHWCLLDILERCPPERECIRCALYDDCRGVAKTKCDGFFHIDDAISIKQRVSLDRWQAEMLCLRPSTHLSVFPMFDPSVHVREEACPNGRISLAMDFGYRNPFACLWIADDGRVVHVIDELIAPSRLLSDLLDDIESRPWRIEKSIACDPAGNAPNEQTGRSNVQLLRARGYTVRTRGSSIQDGLEAIRARLQPAAGSPTLFIHPRCKQLIQAMRSYRYGEKTGEKPLKDGVNDHPIDALRYWLVNHQRHEVRLRKY